MVINSNNLYKNNKNIFFVYIFFIILTISLFIAFNKHSFALQKKVILNLDVLKTFIFSLLILGIFFYYLLKKFYIKICKVNLLILVISFIIVVVVSKIRFNSIVETCFINIVIAIIIISFYISNLRLYDKKNNKFLNKNEKIFFILIFFILFYLGVTRIISFYKAFNMNAGDLGIFTNTIYQAGAGLPQYTLLEDPGLGIHHRNSIHFQPFIYFLSLVFKTEIGIELLLFLEVLFLFLSAIILLKISFLYLENMTVAYIIVFSYFLSPYFIRTVDYDFHITPFYTFFILGFIWASLLKKNFLIVLFFIFTMILREDAVFYLFFINIFFYFTQRRRIYIYLALISFAYFILLIKFLMPAYSPFNFLHSGTVLNLLPKIFEIFFSKEILGQLFFSYLPSGIFLLLIPTLAFFFILLPPLIILGLYTAGDPHAGDKILFTYQYSAFALVPLYFVLLYNLKIILNKCIILKSFKIEIGLFILVINIFLHISWYPIFDDKYLILIILILIFLPFIYYIQRLKINLIFIIGLITILVFWRGYYKYNKYRGIIEEEKKTALEKAINYIKKEADIKTAIITHHWVTPRLYNYQYVSAINKYSPEYLLNPLIRNKIKKIYLLLDYNKKFLNDNDRIKDLTTSEVIVNYLIKLGYKKEMYYNLCNIKIFKFEK